MNGNEMTGWFKAVRAINGIVHLTDLPAPTSAIRTMCGFTRRELRDMERSGWLVRVQVKNPQTSVLENGYYVKGGIVPTCCQEGKAFSVTRTFKDAQAAKDIVDSGRLGEVIKSIRSELHKKITEAGENPQDYQLRAESPKGSSTITVFAEEVRMKRKDGVTDDPQHKELADHQYAASAEPCEVDYTLTGESRS